MLYTVNKSPLAAGNLASALRIAPAGAPILLYEDGVYAALAGAQSEALLRQALPAHPVYALAEDLQARGLAATGRLIEGIQVVDYAGFVALVEEHDVAPWL